MLNEYSCHSNIAPPTDVEPKYTLEEYNDATSNLHLPSPATKLTREEIYNIGKELSKDQLQLYKDIYNKEDKEIAPYLLT